MLLAHSFPVLSLTRSFLRVGMDFVSCSDFLGPRGSEGPFPALPCEHRRFGSGPRTTMNLPGGRMKRHHNRTWKEVDDPKGPSRRLS